MSDYVCSNCGSDRIGAIQRGIDNWPVAQCFECGPKGPGGVPDEDGTEKGRLKREKAIAAASRKRLSSKKAIHTALRPVVLRAEYVPKTKPVEAPTMGLFD